MENTKHKTQNSNKEPVVIYEDGEILVVDKPAGLLMHAHVGTAEPTLVEWLLKNYPKIKNVGETESEYVRSGLVHRLDKETSGVVMVAKTQKAYLFLKKQFASGSREEGFKDRPKKVYQALVLGNIKEDQGMIDRPIGRSRTDARRRTVGSKASSALRDAVTYYKVLDRFSCGGEEKYTFVEAYPKTGRTHQVRVHLGSLGKPVVCDALYAPGKVCPLGLERQALHAFSIELLIPNGEKKRFEAPLPADMKKALEQLRSLC